MARYSITLSDEQDLALTARLDAWQLAEAVDPPLTAEVALTRIVAGVLDITSREIETTLLQLHDVAQKLPAPVRAQMLAGLTAQQQARLGHLLTTTRQDDGDGPPPGRTDRRP